MTKFFVDEDGNYLGGYDGPPEENPHKNGIEVPNGPDHCKDKWNGSTWIKYEGDK